MDTKSKVLILVIVPILISAIYLESLKAQPARCCLFIGTSISMTGSFATLGSSYKESFLLWGDKINKKGGLLGYRVKFVFYDDQSNPGIASDMYMRLIKVDNVHVLFGHYISTITSSISSVAENFKYPMIVFGPIPPTIWQRGYRYIFQLHPEPREYFTGIIEIASKFGAKRLSMLSSRRPFFEMVSFGAEGVARKEGMDIASFDEYPMGTLDFSPYLMRIKGQRPDIFIGSTTLSDAVVLVKDLKALDISPNLIALGEVASKTFYEQLDKDAEYILGYSIWEDVLKTTGNQEFIDEYEKMWGRSPDFHAAGAWAMCQVLEKAVKKAGTLDKEKIRDALSASIVATVLPGEFRVDHTGKNIGNKVVIIQWQAGKKEIVWPYGLATSKLVYPVPAWKLR